MKIGLRQSSNDSTARRKYQQSNLKASQNAEDNIPAVAVEQNFEQNLMESELFNLQKKIQDLESKLTYGQEPINGGSGESHAHVD